MDLVFALVWKCWLVCNKLRTIDWKFFRPVIDIRNGQCGTECMCCTCNDVITTNVMQTFYALSLMFTRPAVLEELKQRYDFTHEQTELLFIRLKQ